MTSFESHSFMVVLWRACERYRFSAFTIERVTVETTRPMIVRSLLLFALVTTQACRVGAPTQEALQNSVVAAVPSIYSSARPELDRSPVCRDHACMISSFVRARPLARPQTQTLSC